MTKRAGKSRRSKLAEKVGVFKYTPAAFGLVWRTSRELTLLLAALSLVAGTLPGAVAWIGKEIVDAVLAAAQSHAAPEIRAALIYVGIEFGLVATLSLVQRILQTSNQLLRALLSNEVNEMILEKSLKLDLRSFENPEIYDQMTRARREASRRPLSVVQGVYQLGQNTISLVTYAVILLQFSAWVALLLALATIPSFIAETKFSKEAFRLFSRRAPENRMQRYLETLIAREDHIKEVKLFGLGPTFLKRYQEIFKTVYAEDRALQIRRGVWGFALSLLATGAFYGAYVWIVIEAAHSQITIGEMTMYLMVFKQAQSALSSILGSLGGMFEDNLYLSNLYEFLELEEESQHGEATSGPTPGDGLRFEDVAFRYPDAETNALEGVSLHLKPGRKLALVGENGAGKTTLIKLMTRLYDPTEGRILLDGLDLRDWSPLALRRRVGIIFQDFVRYQLRAGENIGVGDVRHLEDEDRWRDAAEKGMADEVIAHLPEGYETQLGRWFNKGQELSLGQWQKVALSRAFMREEADLLVLDEPTASMDAAAEAEIFDRFGEQLSERMAILISHRFSTVRMADEVIVLDRGRIVERGSHEALLAAQGRYARLFELQAQGYR